MQMISRALRESVNRNSTPSRAKPALRLLCAALLFLCLGAAQPEARAAPVFDPPPAGTYENSTQFLSVPAAAFHPDANSFYYDYINYGDELVHQGYSGGGSPAYYAPLMLPDLSTITKVSFWYRKESTTGDHNIQLIRTVLTDGSIPTFNVLADLHADAASGYQSVSTPPGFSALVDNGAYSYALKYTTDRTEDGFYRVLVEYTLPGGTPVPETLTIPTAAFVSFSDSQQVYNVGGQIMNGSIFDTSHVEAPVLLPQGATVQNTTFYLYDQDSGLNIEAHLHRTDLKGSWDPALAMADLVSSGTSGWDAVSAPVARYEKIDNAHYAYWVYYQLPPRSEAGFTLIGRELTIDYQRGPAFPVQSISVPAAAFTPKEDGQNYENHGRYLKSLTGDQSFVAPLYLPHGKYIRSVRFYYERIGPPLYEMRAYLRGTDAPAAHPYPNIYLQSGGGTGWTSTDSGLLSGLQVDNLHKRYWLVWEMLTPHIPGNYVLPSGMVVEVSDYNTLLFLPLVDG